MVRIRARVTERKREGREGGGRMAQRESSIHEIESRKEMLYLAWSLIS